jgi:uncharacterized protein (TIGR00369 family)
MRDLYMAIDLPLAAKTRIYDVIAAGPFGQHVGISVDEVEVDRVVVRMKGAPHVMNALGIIHGGATAALLDSAVAAAAWATPEAKETTRGTTVALMINFIAGGYESDLIAEAQVISRGGTLTIVDVTARDANGRIIAKAQATYKLDVARDRRLASG